MKLRSLFRRKPRVLKNVEVSEISAVPSAANPLSKILIRKRADRVVLRAKVDEATARLAASVKSIVNDPDCKDKNGILAKSFGQFLDHLNVLITKSQTPLKEVTALHEIFKNDNERAEPDLSNTNAGMPNRRRRRAGDDDETETERRSREADEKDKDMTEKSHSLDNIVKRHGFVALAKSINAGSVTLTEEEYTKALIDDCARGGVSFEKVFCANTPEGVEIRKGRERCRDEAFLKGTLMPIMPTQTDSLQAAGDVNSDEPDAYEKLVEMSERMRAASPEMTLAQAFERTYTSPEVKELAELERRQARSRLPTTGARVAG
jgi:hypothetical protein